MIARWGGDEFIVLLANINIENLKELEKRIQEACLKDNNEPVPLSISVDTQSKKKRNYRRALKSPKKECTEKAG